MFRTILILILVYAVYRFVKSIKIVDTRKNAPKTNYENMDIQDADFKEKENE